MTADLIPLRVLIVDDSAMMRRALTLGLESMAQVRVVGTASGGEEGLRMAHLRRPDLITVDKEMPGMDGIELTQKLRLALPDSRLVLITSTSPATVAQCMAKLGGAPVEFLPKPSSNLPFQRWVDTRLAPLIARFHSERSRHRVALGSSRPPLRSPVLTTPAPPGLILVGASTGGPRVLHDFLGALDPSCGAPVAIVQHMPPIFTGVLAKSLSAATPWRVKEAREGDRLRAGEALVAPGDYHLTLVQDRDGWRAHLDQGPMRCGVRPAFDRLLESVAEHNTHNVRAAVLTGMGYDGLEGCRALRRAGGEAVRIYCQDEDSAVVWGMPSAVISDGLANAVGSGAALGERIGQWG